MAAEGRQLGGLALALAVATAPVACAGTGHGDAQAPPAAAPPAAPAPRIPSPSRVSPAPSAMSVNVGGGFWSPRLRAVEQALRQCDPVPTVPAASPNETAIFGALASLSLDGRAFQPDVPSTCASSCVRPAWSGADARGCGALASLASLQDMIWRVDGGDVPAVTAALIADSELSFTVGDVRWNIDQGTDYPWSNHVGLTLCHRTAQPADTGEPAPVERALDVRVQLPEWIDPSSARISARGRMLAPNDFGLDGRTLTVRGPWSDGDRMHISFPMPPRRVPADGGVEIWRGPLRYVAEAVDQPGSALADVTIAPGDALRDVPYVLGAIVPGDAAVRQGDPVTQRPTPQPDAAANSAPNGIMAVMVERRARGLPDLVLVPLMFAGNRGDMPRVGTFAAPAP